MVAHQCRGRDLLGGFYLVSPPVSDFELDVAVAPALAQQLADLADKKPDQLIFDMAAVGFLDCAAAGVLFAAARSMLPGRNPVIRAPCPLVRRLLEMSALNMQCDLAG